MGYRNYLGIIKKSDFIIYKLSKDEDFFHEKYREIFELGKHLDKEFYESLVVLEDLRDENDNELKIVSPDTIPLIVEIYRKLYVDYLEKMLDPAKDKFYVPNSEVSAIDLSNYEMTNHIKKEIREWGDGRLVYSKDLKNNNIVNSWSYNYVIFELLHQYKNIDFNKYHLVWSGY